MKVKYEATCPLCSKEVLPGQQKTIVRGQDYHEDCWKKSQVHAESTHVRAQDKGA